MDDCLTKWVWMTDYCKKMLWNPHDIYFWKKAEEEYNKVRNNS